MIIGNEAGRIMLDDAVNAYPEECCGFMFGSEDDKGLRIIDESMPVVNAKEGDKRRRFEIAPADYLKAERYAASTGKLLLGIYHSHPNHPAIPSEHDRSAAMPFFSYLIISIEDNVFNHQRSWRLNDNRHFEEETINTIDAGKVII